MLPVHLDSDFSGSILLHGCCSGVEVPQCRTFGRKSAVCIMYSRSSCNLCSVTAVASYRALHNLHISRSETSFLLPVLTLPIRLNRGPRHDDFCSTSRTLIVSTKPLFSHPPSPKLACASPSGVNSPCSPASIAPRAFSPPPRPSVHLLSRNDPPDIVALSPTSLPCRHAVQQPTLLDFASRADSYSGRCDCNTSEHIVR